VDIETQETGFSGPIQNTENWAGGKIY